MRNSPENDKPNPVVTATAIPTQAFFAILDRLRHDGWTVREQADFSYKFIDVDFYTLTRGDETIRMHWDIWMEGEIQARQNLLDALARKLTLTFAYDSPVHFKNPE